MIVAEYLASVLAPFNSTAATFTGTTRFSACLCPQPATIVVRKRLLVTANALIALHFILSPPIDFVFNNGPMPPCLLSFGRIILKELRHHLLQVLVILVWVCLEVDRLDGVAAPDELFSSDVI